MEQVIECRRILKYTYVLGHYLLDNTTEKELYEHHQVQFCKLHMSCNEQMHWLTFVVCNAQEMLEKHTERLSELTENEGFQNPSDRTHVINLTRITEKFVNSMLSVMMEGQCTFSFTEMGETKA